MSRISATLSGIERTLLDRLSEANAATAASVLRMATGHAINFPSDDPSTFVMLSGLQSQFSMVTDTMANVTAAGTMISQVQTAMKGIRTQLTTIRKELVSDADGSLTPDERAASQAKIDQALDAITSLSHGQIDGRRLLDGSADYIYSGQNPDQVRTVAAASARSTPQTISGEVTAAATQAQLAFTDSGNTASNDALITLSGERGSADITITAGESLSQVAQDINKTSYETGVTASFDGNHAVTMTSVDYGAKATVAIDVQDGNFAVTGGDGHGIDHGTNASAVINGQTISADSSSVDGNRFSLSQNGLRYDIEFASGFTGRFDPITVSGHALSFALSTDVSQQASLAIPSLDPARLGGVSGRLDELRTGGALAGLGGNTSQAIRVVDESLGALTRIEGNVNGFYTAAISSASGLFSAMEKTLQSAIDGIDSVDDAQETQLQSRYQMLASNAAAGLYILSQQRSNIVQLVKKIAGLD